MTFHKNIMLVTTSDPNHLILNYILFLLFIIFYLNHFISDLCELFNAIVEIN